MRGASSAQTAALSPFLQAHFDRARRCPCRHALGRVRLQGPYALELAEELAVRLLVVEQLAAARAWVAEFAAVTTARRLATPAGRASAVRPKWKRPLQKEKPRIEMNFARETE